MTELLQYIQQHPVYYSLVIVVIWCWGSSFFGAPARQADALEKIAAILERIEKGK